MREKRKPHRSSSSNAKKLDVLRQIVDQQYTKLFSKIRQNVQRDARSFLENVVVRPAPKMLSRSQILFERNDDELTSTENLSVVISDGNNQKGEKMSVTPTIMPSLNSVRELISYVPTLKNIAMRGYLTGIPYLGDKFDDDDQQIIDSISGESKKQTNFQRKKKLDDQSLEILYQNLRSNQILATYSNEQIIDAILYFHRDSSARTRLFTAANIGEKKRSNIDECDTLDLNINDLIVKPWCDRFCPRCYSYNCLLHKEKASHLPLPKRFSIIFDTNSTPCSSTCYKHEREHLKRALSPSHQNDRHQISSDSIGNVKKRCRRSAAFDSHCHNENQPVNFNFDCRRLFEKQKSSIKLNSISESNILINQWTLTDRSLFRLFYFLFDGDLCSIKVLFDDQRTCQNMYEQFILDAKYFAENLSITDGLPLTIRQSYRRRMLDGATRAFLFHIKKHFNPNSKSTSAFKSAYQPCTHEGPCTLDNPNCHCMQTGTYCEKFCNCPADCPHRFPGCACKGACLLNNCLCCAEGRECDPDLCHKCGASLFIQSNLNGVETEVKLETEVSVDHFERKTLPSFSQRTIRTKATDKQSIRQHSLRSCRVVEPSYKLIRNSTKRTQSRLSLTPVQRSNTLSVITCANISLQRKLYKQILVAESDVAGYGAFLGSEIAHSGDLICEYTGEIISEDEADRRGRLYDKQACSYLFNLDTDRCVDARQYGSKIRFANHSSKPNCVAKIKLVNGDYRIGIYAKQVIFQGEELFFEYMYDAHQRQQFVNNERVDHTEKEGFTILKRYANNLLLVRPSYD